MRWGSLAAAALAGLLSASAAAGQPQPPVVGERLELRLGEVEVSGDQRPPVLFWRVLGTGQAGRSRDCPERVAAGIEPEPGAGPLSLLLIRATDGSGNETCLRWQLEPQGKVPADYRWLEISVAGRPPSEVLLAWGGDDSPIWDFLAVREDRERVKGSEAPIELDLQRPRLLVLAGGGQPFAAEEIRLGPSQALQISASDAGSGIAGLTLAAQVVVPDLWGLGRAEAKEVLEERGLQLELERMTEIATGPRVISQDPLPGSTVPWGSAVRAEFGAADADPVRVPDLFGLELPDAESRLEASRLRRGDVAPRLPRVRGPRVGEQSPGSGTEVPPATTVDVGLRSRVPDLRGLTVVEAWVRVEGAELARGAVLPPRLAEDPQARVVGQEPGAGQEKPLDTTVDLNLGPVEPTEVPDLLGLVLGEAEALLEAARLEKGRVTPRLPATDAAVVIRQEPPSGAEVPIGVTVDIGLGAPVPDLVGLRLSAAEERILAANLQLGSVAPEGLEPGRAEVTWQLPEAADSPVPLETTVDLQARELDLATVPELRGLDLVAAEAQLVAAELVLGEIEPRPPERPGARVITQRPEAGGEVPRGSPVRVGIGTVVPLLRGMELDAAERRLRAAELVLGSVEPRPPERPGAVVTDQIPAAGTEVLLDSPVNAVVGARVPDLIGLELDAAESLLEASGLSLAPPDPRAVGRPGVLVFDQIPTGGALLRIDLPVRVTLGAGVPDVYNLELDEAREVLENSALVPGTVAPSPQPVARMRVRRQDPEAGERAAIGATVDLFLAVPVPPLRGRAVEEVPEILRLWGLVSAGTPNERPATYAGPEAPDLRLRENMVLGQTPAAGVLVDPGTPVQITIARSLEPPPGPRRLWPWLVLVVALAAALVAHQLRGRAAPPKGPRFDTRIEPADWLQRAAEGVGEPEPLERREPGLRFDVTFEARPDPGDAKIEAKGSLIGEERETDDH